MPILKQMNTFSFACIRYITQHLTLKYKSRLIYINLRILASLCQLCIHPLENCKQNCFSVPCQLFFQTSPRITIRRKATCRPEISIGWFYKPEINLYSFKSLKCCKLLVTTVNTTLINILVNCHLEQIQTQTHTWLGIQNKSMIPPTTLPSATSPI